MSRPMLEHLLLLRPEEIEAQLSRVEAAGIVPKTPNTWQITLGVLRMWHRVAFRPETIGTCAADPVRPTWRARLLHARPLRFPFLLRENAVAPLDFSGLLSSPERVIRHLLGAHHDANQFAYDLSLLLLHPGKLEELTDRARAVVDGADPRSEWLRDLVVHERYHERLLRAAEQALADGVNLPSDEARDPDISFTGYLRWCAAQPESQAQTWRLFREGEWTVADGWTAHERADDHCIADVPRAGSVA